MPELQSLAYADLTYDGLETDQYLGMPAIAATVTQEPFFTEGPAADAAGDIYFSNVPAHQILKYSVARKELSVFRERSNAANGLAFDHQGRLLICEGGSDDRGQLTRLDLSTGELTVLADRWHGKPLGAPNDLCLDAQGRIYFTSRSTDPDRANLNAVYRLDPDGTLNPVLVAPDIDMPNGLEISPDGRWLYLVESDSREHRARCLKRYALQENGSVAAGVLWVDFYPGRSGDGLCVDRQGHVYVAAGLHKTRGTSETLATRPGIHVFAPDGRLVAFRQTPDDTITNCAFGGPDFKTLFVTCGRHLLQIPAVHDGQHVRV